MPPAIPAAIAFAGSIWGLFNLTLGQDPANALPNWSPAIGWSAALGSLALASVLAWIGLVKRKCPDCGSRQMLDAMEEEGLIASERLAAQKAAVDEALAGLGRKAPGESGRELRAQVEAEVRAAQAKEHADQLAAREKETREETERRVRAEHERNSVENERVLRRKLEEELRPQLEARLRSEIEQQLRASASATTPAADQSVTPRPVTTATALAPSAAPAPRPVTPPPTTTARALAAGATPAPRPVTPAPVSAAKALATSPAPATRPVTPPPVSTAKALATSPAPATRPVTPPPHATNKVQPAAPQTNVETAPLALKASTSRSNLPAVAPTASGKTPPPQPQSTAADSYERAKRRARVILSDLSVYHRDELLKAARAADPKKELGTLWRDAVISYNEVASPEIRSATNYLEEELDRYLVQLRSA